MPACARSLVFVVFGGLSFRWGFEPSVLLVVPHLIKISSSVVFHHLDLHVQPALLGERRFTIIGAAAPAPRQARGQPGFAGLSPTSMDQFSEGAL